MQPSEFGFAALPPVTPVSLNPMYEYASSSMHAGMSGHSTGQAAGHALQRVGSFHQHPGAFRRMDSQDTLVLGSQGSGQDATDFSSVVGKNNSSESSFSAFRMYLLMLRVDLIPTCFS